MSFSYFISNFGSNECYLSDISGVVEYKIRRGIPASELGEFQLRGEMDRAKPFDTKLYDFVKNIEAWLVISDRVREFIIAESCDDDVEFLPLEIYDHRNKLVEDKYWVVHPIGTYSCVNEKRSRLRRDERDRTTKVEGLVLEEDKIPENIHLFRVDKLARLTVVSAELAEKIASQFSNFNVLNINQFTKL